MSAFLDPALEQLKKSDPHRFATLMLAPEQHHADLAALYGLNVELSTIRLKTHEAMAGMIRLQWWREVIDGQRNDEAQRHPVALTILKAKERHNLPMADFETILLAREKDLDAAPFQTWDEVRDYAEASSGYLTKLAAQILAGSSSDKAHDKAVAAGTAYGLVGLARGLAYLLNEGWSPIPAEAAADRRDPAALAKVAEKLCQMAGAELAKAQGAVPRQSLSAHLVALQARTHLKNMKRLKFNVLDERAGAYRPIPFSMLWASMIGRI